MNATIATIDQTSLSIDPRAWLLLDTLWEGTHWSYIWALSKPGMDEVKDSNWFRVGERPDIPKWLLNNYHLYYSVHGATERVNHASHVRLKKEDPNGVEQINALFIDVDPKPEYPTTTDIVDRINQLCDTHGWPVPTVMVSTGRGIQALWLLDGGVRIDDRNRTQMDALQKAWVTLWGADEGAKDLVRIFRLPGSINWKDELGPNYPTVSFIDEPGDKPNSFEKRLKYRRYSLVEIEKLCEPILNQPTIPPAQKASHAQNMDLHVGGTNPWFVQAALNGEIDNVCNARQGGRNVQLNKSAYKLGGYVGAGELEESVVKSELLSAALSIGLSESEARDTIASGIESGKKSPTPAPEPKMQNSEMMAGVEAMARESLEQRKAAQQNGNSPISNIPLDYVGPAIWRINDEDTPLNVTGALPPIAGIAYFTTDHGKGGTPGDQLLLPEQEVIVIDSRESTKIQVVDSPLSQARSSTTLPHIQTNNNQLDDVLRVTLAALIYHNTKNPTMPVVYVRGGELVRVLKNEKSIQPLSKDALTGVLGEVARWHTKRFDKRTKETVVTDVFPPREVVGALAGKGEWLGLPKLSGLVSFPVYAGKGHWVMMPGYDSKTGLYSINEMVLGDTIPTDERIEWAKDQILVQLLGDFPFKDNASQAHAISLVLLPFVRHRISGPTPLYITDAPTQGTGKGLLNSACCYPALGEEVSSTPAKTDEDEWRKAITALLEKGSSHINIDNIVGEFKSASLSTALTQGVWEERRLGQTQILKLPIHTIWTATANNVQPDKDMARRLVWIRLDANMERPQDRTGFRHKNLLSWAKEHRSELVTACIVLINNWLAKGEPEGNYIKGSYPEWATVMGGILDEAGITGFLENEHELSNTAVGETQAWKAFVDAWADAHHEQWVTPKELFPIASHYDPSITGATVQGLGILDELLGSGNERSRQTRLGIRLNNMRDQVINERKIIRGEKLHGYQQWRLMQVPTSK